MLYDSYYKKISKIAAFWQKVFKHIVLIAIVVGVILAAFIAFMITKGIVFDDNNITSEKIELVYGKSVSLNASALFSDVDYEYSTDGGESWNSGTPILPGEYKIRVVANGFFGQSRYGKIYSLTIAPKKVDVKIDCEESIYGELLPISADLSYGDTISCDKFDFEDFSKKETTVTPNVDAIKVLNSKGEDVTAGYILTPISSSVKLNPREITVVVEDKGTIYDGTEFSYDGWEIVRGSLALDDELKPVFDKVLIDVGEIENTPSLTVFKKIKSEDSDSINYLDVTHHYDIKTVIGKLSVDYRPLIIESESQKKVYDGTPLEYLKYKIAEGELAEEQVIKCISGSSITNVGIKNNILSFIITDKDDNDTTFNYSIIYVLGTLEVTRRPIKIETPSLQKGYDGKEFVNTEYTITDGSLVEGHYIEIVDRSSITNVGEIANEIEVVIYDSLGVDVTSNYDIDYDFGTLKITPYSLNVSSEGGSWIYDANYHYGKINHSGLCEGHEIRFSELKSVIDVSSIKNYVEVLAIYDAEGNDVMSNYSITYGDFGTLEVLKRKVSFAAETTEVYYDGVEKEFSNYKVLSELGIAATDELRQELNKFCYASDEAYENQVLGYSVYSTTRDKDVTSNYDITAEDGKVKINKCILKFNLDSVEKEYDSTPLVLQSSNCHLYGAKFPEGHTIDFVFIGSQTEIGVYEGATIDLEKTKIMRGEEDVTSNFELHANKSKLTVSKRKIVISTMSSEKIYDTQALVAEQYAVSYGTLIEGHTIEATFGSSITNVGSIPNEVSIKIFNSDGIEETDNYEIGYDFGTLEILKFNIQVELSEKSIVYNSRDPKTLYLSEDDVVSITPDELPEEHVLILEFRGAQTDIGVCKDATLDYSMTKVMWGDIDVTENFNITANEVRLTVFPPENTQIVLKPEDVVVTYDGTIHTPKKLSDKDGFLNILEDIGYVFSFDYIGEQREAGSVETYIENLSITYRDEDKTDYFDVKYEKGSVTVEKFKLDFVLETKSKEYDRTPLTFVRDDCEDVISKIPDGHTIEFEFIGSQTEVGIYRDATVDIDSVKIMRGDVDATDNFEITSNKAMLVVLRRQIVITTYSAEKTYDGTELVSPEYEIVGGTLLDGHTIKQISFASLTNAGEIKNEQAFEVINAYGGDESANYSFSYNLGKLKVNKFRIEVLLQDKTAIYDNDNPTALKLTEEDIVSITNELPEGHNLTLAFEGSQLDIGIYYGATVDLQNTVVMFNGENVVDDFEIVANEVKLSVYPAERTVITLKPEKKEAIYNGKPHKADALADEDGFLQTLADLGYVIVVDSYEGERIDCGIGASSIKPENVHVMLNGEDVTYYFEFDCQNGEIQVNKFNLELVFRDKSKTYNGTALTLTDADYTIDVDEWFSNHVIIFAQNAFIGSQTEVGIYKDATVDINGIQIMRGNVDATANFDISVNSVSLKVYPKENTKITLQPEDIFCTYDGNTHRPTSLVDTDGFLAILEELGYSIDVDYVGERRDAGTTYTSIKNPRIIFESEDVTREFVIQTKRGKIEIAKFDLKDIVIPESKIKPYDSKPLELTAEDCEFELPENHTMEIKFSGSQTEVGSCEVSVVKGGIKIFLGEEDVTSNFNITYPNSKCTLTVEKLKIIITTDSASKEYDSTPLTKQSYTLVDASGNTSDVICALMGIQIDVSVTGTITNVGTIDNTVDISITGIESDNVDIEYNLGTLEVTKRKITVTTESDSKEYNSEPLTCNKYSITDIDGNNAEMLKSKFGITVNVNVIGSIIEKGSCDNIAEAVIEGELKDNFEIEYSFGTLTIRPAGLIPLKVKVASASKIYDGKSLEEELFFMVADDEFEATGYKLSYIKVVMPGNVETLMASEINLYDGGKVGYLQFKVMDGENDITDKYYLELIHPLGLDEDYLVAEIIKADIQLTTGSTTQYYSENKKLQNASVTLSFGELAEGDYLVISDTRKLVQLESVGSVSNELLFKDVMIKNSNGDNVTNNYNIIIVEGILEFLE